MSAAAGPEPGPIGAGRRTWRPAGLEGALRLSARRPVIGHVRQQWPAGPRAHAPNRSGQHGADPLPADAPLPRPAMDRPTRPMRPNTVLPNTVPPNTVPPNTVPPNTVPPNTVPPDTVPPNTVPPTTVPPDTVPPDTVPRSSGLPPGPDRQVRVPARTATPAANRADRMVTEPKQQDESNSPASSSGPGGSASWLIGSPAAPAGQRPRRPSSGWSAPAAAAVSPDHPGRPDQADRPFGAFAAALAVPGARPGTDLVAAVSTPVELPGLIVRPVPADQARRPDHAAELPAPPRPDEHAAPPRPAEQDRPWPRPHREQQPAAARPPDLDAIADAVIARLQRQQRLARERRG